MALPLIIAIIAAAAVLLIVFGLAGSQPVDPVQARLTQLGSMQARNLEELELQAPFFDRTIRPLAQRLSGMVQRITSPKQPNRTERRLAMAGKPGGLTNTDFLGLKAVVAIGAAIAMSFFFFILAGNPGFGIVATLGGGGVGFFVPEFWLG